MLSPTRSYTLHTNHKNPLAKQAISFSAPSPRLFPPQLSSSDRTLPARWAGSSPPPWSARRLLFAHGGSKDPTIRWFHSSIPIFHLLSIFRERLRLAARPLLFFTWSSPASHLLWPLLPNPPDRPSLLSPVLCQFPKSEIATISLIHPHQYYSLYCFHQRLQIQNLSDLSLFMTWPQ